jgi:hypothetical protein
MIRSRSKGWGFDFGYGYTNIAGTFINAALSTSVK